MEGGGIVNLGCAEPERNVAWPYRSSDGVGSAMAVLECIATLLFSLLVLLTVRPRWSY
jgi:hypothetical protein